MEKINKNHWYIEDNSLLISLLRFHVKISIINNNDNLIFSLEIVNSNMESLLLYFNTLEEAISFTENVISNKNNLIEIATSYQESREEKKYVKKGKDR